MIRGDLFIAPAIRAKRFTKRKVHINADAAFRIVYIELFLELILPPLRIGIVIPKWYRRVTGIPWHRLVVFSNKQGINCRLSMQANLKLLPHPKHDFD